MWKTCLTDCLAGLGSGVVGGLYLVLIVRAINAVKGPGKLILSLSWPLQVGISVILVNWVVVCLLVPSVEGPASYWYAVSWIVAWGAIVVPLILISNRKERARRSKETGTVGK